MSDCKQYTAEFKRDAVRLMTEGKQSSSEVSRSLGFNVSLLGKWKRQLALAEEVQAMGRRLRRGGFEFIEAISHRG